ncbi:MAG: ComF family protein [candidate division KSB1 bacterium]|nr:ComF family protein [candidate division KSB1 bacterium]
MGNALAWREKLEELLAPLLDFVFPPYCMFCGAHLARHECLVCYNCWFALPLTPSPGGVVHTGGAKHGEPQHLDASVAVWRYDEQVERIIHLFKYGGYTCLARPLGLAVGGTLVATGLCDRGDVLVPIPLHPARRRERGYNQSELLARRAAKVCGLPVETDLLRRTRYTRPQSQLGASERAKNVAGAFAVRLPAEVGGRRVILVDDVLTTGATASECARVLKEAGALEVFLATAARA